MQLPAKAPFDRTCQLLAMKHESTVYQFHSIYHPISLIAEDGEGKVHGREDTVDKQSHTDILQAPGEPIPPISIPPMAGLAVELGVMATAAVVEEPISISISGEAEVSSERLRIVLGKGRACPEQAWAKK